MFKRIAIMAILTISMWAAETVYAFDLDGVEIHGFASTGYLKSSDNNFLGPTEDGTFEFNEAAVNFSTQLSDNIRVGLQLYSFDLGDTGNNDITLDWATLDYKWKEALNVRVGKMKTPLGLYNETRDFDMLRTGVFLPQGIYYGYLRDIQNDTQGGGIYGNILLGKAGSLRYSAYYGTQSVDVDSGFSKYVSRNDMVLTDVQINDTLTGGLRWRTPLKGFTLSATYLQLDTDYVLESSAIPGVTSSASSPENKFYTFSAEYSTGNLTIAAEYQDNSGDLTLNTDLSAVGQPNPPAREIKQNFQSYYGLVSYRFTDWFEAGGYYSVTYPDGNDKDGEQFVLQGLPDYLAWQKDLALSIRFDITDSWLVKLEYHFMDGAALCTALDNPQLSELEDDWELFAVKTTFSF